MNTRALTRNLRSRKASSRRRLAFDQLEERRLLSTLTVTSIADDGSAGTLRYEIGQANSNAGIADTINFDPTVFATPRTISLTSGQLELKDAANTTISGPGADLLSISGNNASRVFSINYGSAAISGLTVTGGSASTGGGVCNQSGTLTLTDCTVSGNSATNGGGVFTGGVYNYDYGGTYSGVTTLTNCTVTGNSASNGGGLFSSEYGTIALANTIVSGNSASNNGGGLCTVGYYSATTLTNCIVSGNSAANNGGALANETGTLSTSDGTTALSDCTLSGNTAGNDGGGLYNRGGTATLTNCAVSGNSAGAFGGGLLDASGHNTTTLTNCTVSANSATNGAGVVNIDGTTTLTNCTVSGNSANSVGGGLYNNGGGSTTLTNCTVSGNSGYGGGLYNSYGGTATLTNTIVAGNLSDADISGGGGYSGNNNLIGGNPLLAPLGNYGGPTQTMALLPGSPAIDAGTSTGATATDQRGEGRVGAVDIGAFESQGFAFTPAVRSTPQSSDIGMAFIYPLAVNVAANNPAEPVDGGVVNFVAIPASGATAMLLGPSAVDIVGGQAAVSAAPNNARGSYTVVASAGASFASSFALTNTSTPFSSLIVNTTSNSPFPGTGSLSLPEAVAFANVDSLGISSITFDPTVFATLQTITLGGSQLELSNTSEPETITGPAAGVTVDAGGLSRVFHVDGDVNASISGMTVSGGSAASGGGLYNSGTTVLTDVTLSGNSASDGGGLWSSGTAMLTDCTISGNTAGRRGGGVYSYYGATMLTNCTVSGNSAASGGGLRIYSGTTTLTHCTLSGNSSSTSGGGLTNLGGTATLTNCTVSGNSAVDDGGGLRNVSGTITLINSTISGNSATTGGGLDSYYSTTTLTNCTVSGNSAGHTGGGLYNYGGSTTLTNCTVSGNSAGFTGGGLDNAYYGTVTFGNTIVAGNTAAKSPDVSGGITSLGNNLIGKTNGSSGWVGSDLRGTIASPFDALLAPLADYGGPTRTMALLPGSQAIGAGSNALIPAGVTTDQRGLPRIVNTVVDIGAFESSGFTIAVTSGSDQSTGVLTAFQSNRLAVTVTAKNPMEPVAGGLVGFNPPLSGASATISGGPATISAAGTASIRATANGIAGSYSVVASASGTTAPAVFRLTNDQLIIALDPSASAALSLAGNATINTPGVVYVDSSSSTALSASGNAQIKAAAIDVHGGVKKSGNSTLTPTPVTRAPLLAVTALPSPSTAGMSRHGSFVLTGHSSATIQPGIYSSISMSGYAKLTLSSGIYIILGGGFAVSGNSSITGSGVMIVNAGSLYPFSGGTYGSITLSGNGTSSLSPMTRGPYAGIVFFQPSDNKKTMTVTANATGITGTIYAPAAALSESGTGALNASLIVDRLEIEGSGSAGTSTPTNTKEAMALFDPTTLTTSVGTIPLALKIKVTDALGKNVHSSTVPVVSVSAFASARTLVPQPAAGNSLPDNLLTFDATNEANRFNLKTRVSMLGS